MKNIIHCKQLVTNVTNDLEEKFLLLAFYKTNIIKNKTNLTLKQKQYYNTQIMKIISEIKFLTVLKEELLTKINPLPLIEEPNTNYNWENFRQLMRTQCLTPGYFIEIFIVMIITFIICVSCPPLSIYTFTFFIIHTFTRTLPIIPFLFKKVFFNMKKKIIKWRNLKYNHKNKYYKNKKLLKLLKLRKCSPNHYYNWKKKYFANINDKIKYLSPSLARTTTETSTNSFNPQLITDSNNHNIQSQLPAPKLLIQL